MGYAASSERDRLAGLFGALASCADVASGFHAEKAIRSAIVATRLAAAQGLDEGAQADTYHLALVAFWAAHPSRRKRLATAAAMT